MGKDETSKLGKVEARRFSRGEIVVRPAVVHPPVRETRGGIEDGLCHREAHVGAGIDASARGGEPLGIAALAHVSANV
jgi:hypothetical protein